MALMKAARELFSLRGFADVSAEEIVQQARVTRGALYHHFKDKRELFGCVCDEMGSELAKHIEDAALPIAASDPWRALIAGIDAFLDACTEGDFHRLVILEAPVVEGWDEWREHAEMHMLGLIRAGLELVMEAGVMAKQPVDVLAPVLFSVLNEGAMLIARADDRMHARREVGETIRRLLEGLRVQRS
jgi:AcrR family transcriptional regulator